MDKQAVKLDKVFTEAQRQVADLLQEIRGCAVDAITIIGECKALVPLCQILTLMDSAVSPSPAKVPAKKRKAKRAVPGVDIPHIG